MHHVHSQAASVSSIHRYPSMSLRCVSATFLVPARQSVRPYVLRSLASIPLRHQSTQTTTKPPQPLQSLSFWKCRHTWRRAMVNTTRCLIGCSLGDLSTMYYLMTHHPEMHTATSMSLSSKPAIDVAHIHIHIHPTITNAPSQ